MSPEIRRRAIKGLIILCAVIAVPMAINWFMTYRLEDTLRKRLRDEVIKASDGFYDFSFDKLKVDLFTGELMIKGLSLFPDSTALIHRTEMGKLPSTYADVYIDTIHFMGINLTWLSSYRKLSFNQFIVNGPQIKIVSPKKQDLPITDSVPRRSIYEHVAEYFESVEARHINLQRATVEYVVEDSLTSHYRLEDFNFTAFKFVLDKNSENIGHLLFSEHFEFKTNKPQVIFDSEHFLLNIKKIKLSTLDSVVHVGGVHLAPKDKYWRQRFTRVGTCVDTEVEDVLLDGIAFRRRGTINYLDARSFSIKQPQIEYYSVAKERKKIEKKNTATSDSANKMWSLYSITSPIFEQISIDNIDVENAKLQYAYTRKEQTNTYTLEKLDFFANSFLIDSMSHKYNFFLYVKDFSVDAENIKGYIPSKNGNVDVERLYLSTIDKSLKISNAEISLLTTSNNDSHIKGSVREIEITEMNYRKGLAANRLNILSPQLEIDLGKSQRGGKHNDIPQAGASNMMDIASSFINYISVQTINIEDGKLSLTDKKDGNTYKLDSLDFYAKNFHIDKQTSLSKDYFFKWDEYRFKFRNFDNLTPDRKHRVKIEEGDFNSVSGNMLIKNLNLTPAKGVKGSYISIATPYASLLGLKEKELRNRKIAFNKFILDSPAIEVVKDVDKVSSQSKKDKQDTMLQFISFDQLSMPSPLFSFYDVAKENSLQITSANATIDSLRWELNESFRIDNFVIESPYISLVEGKENLNKKDKNKGLSIASVGDVSIGKVDIKNPILKIKKVSSYFDFSADNYTLRNLYWNQKSKSKLEIGSTDLSNPTVFYTKKEKVEEPVSKEKLNREQVLKIISNYANEAVLGRVNISNLNLRYESEQLNGKITKHKLTDTYFLLENMDANWQKKKLEVGELAFRTSDINHLLMDSFYTLKIGEVDFSVKRGTLNINHIDLHPNYPKFVFAYLQPRHKDWFKVRVDSIALSGINTERLFSDTVLFVNKMAIDNVLLENFKNQKIEIQHNIMPLLYQEFQRLPLKYQINDLEINNFSVVYEELAKNGYVPSRIPFINMNGRVKDFTNIQSGGGKFYTLYVDGLAMAAAPFVAEWKMPVDSINDKFYLKAEIKDMNMRDFNQLVRPIAPAYVRSGRIHSLRFDTEATSLGATVDMKFEYDSLYVVLLKNMYNDEESAFLTRVLNKWGIDSQNGGNNIRAVHDSIVRDPYHSTFNYFWQIIRPPLTESVGITEEKQNIAHNIITVFNRIKRFFGGGKKEEKKTEEDEKE